MAAADEAFTKGKFDHLKLASDKKAAKALAANSASNDTVLFSATLVKINRKGKGQNRTLLVTSKHILNLMPDNFSKCNRCMQVRQLHHLTKSTHGQEFVIHFTDEYDYRFKTAYRDDVIAALQHAYKTLMSDELQVTEVSDVDGLASQVMTKVAVKKVGGSWGPNPFSSKNKGDGSTAPSTKLEADENDSDDDEHGVSARGGSASVSAPVDVSEGEAKPAAPTAGGAFSKSKYTIDDFNIVKVLGKGAFGKVMLVKANDSGTIYAMKALNKATLIERGEITHTKTERKALEDTHHPFLVHLRFAFQTPTKLYLVMDYCNGGELFYHLKTAGRFAEPRAKLYAAEITSALHHLHTLKIIYRDLKPENVLLDSEGHVRITDFGLAKDAMELADKTHTFCGTPDYLAPEIIAQKGHGRGVDWWSLGTMIYEMLAGLPPFYSENFNVMYERILRKELEFQPPEMFTKVSRELLTGMLQKDPELRLGSSEADGKEIRTHVWFASIDWAALERRELKPSFVPSVKGELDVSNFDEEFTSQEVESVVPDMALNPTSPSKTTNFDGFTFVDEGHLGK